MKRNNLRLHPGSLSCWAVFVFLAIFTLDAENYHQVKSGVCALVPDTSLCFSDFILIPLTVGKDVSMLKNVYKYCIPMVDKFIPDPSCRIILTLDCSGSMCSDIDSNVANDPADRRIAAANNFVDSIAVLCPKCQIGVVEYIGGTGNIIETKLEPLILNTADNVATIHTTINIGKCNQHALQDVHTPKGVTYTGIPLDTAVKMIDRNTVEDIYDSMATMCMKRHIIVMTDGDWNGPTPDSIYAEYERNHPGRPFPMIHGIFMQDTSNTNQYDLSFLESATKQSLKNTPPDTSFYFGGTSAESVAAAFDTLFKNIIDTVIPAGFSSATFTNTLTNKSYEASVSEDSEYNYIIIAPDDTLYSGANKFIITLSGNVRNGETFITSDTLTIIRDTGSITLSTKAFYDTCFVDTAQLSIGSNQLGNNCSGVGEPEIVNRGSDILELLMPQNETGLLKLFSVDGSAVMTRKICGGKSVVDLNALHLSKGVYVLGMQGHRNIARKKIFVAGK